MLENNLLPFAKRLFSANNVFQQDNTPIHTSKLTRTFFQERNTNVSNWPARSPDLNPIENAWGFVVKSWKMSSRPPEIIWNQTLYKINFVDGQRMF